MEDNEFTLVQPLFYNQSKIINQPGYLYRSNLGSKRYYYYFDNDGNVQKAASVTTIIDAQLKQSEWLIKWIADNGLQKAQQIRDTAADYGTLFSIVSADYYKNRSLDLETLPEIISNFKENNKIQYETNTWLYRLKEDMYALHDFTIEFQVEPIALEIMLYSKLGFAGCIDAVVEMTIGTGVNGRILKTDYKFDKKTGEVIENKTTRIRAIIDWKTGRHSFYQANEAQLHFYKLMWNENYPDLEIERVFNWSPKDWDEPEDLKYTFKDQTDSREQHKIMNYLNNFKIDEGNYEDYKFKNISGVLKLGERNGNLQLESFSERINRKHNKYPVQKENLFIKN